MFAVLHHLSLKLYLPGAAETSLVVPNVQIGGLKTILPVQQRTTTYTCILNGFEDFDALISPLMKGENNSPALCQLLCGKMSLALTVIMLIVLL